MPGVVTISSRLDLFLVNSLGLPSNSGMVLHFLLLIIFFWLAVRETMKSEDRVRNALFSSFAFLLSGIWIVSGSIFLNILVLAAITFYTWYIAGKVAGS